MSPKQFKVFFRSPNLETLFSLFYLVTLFSNMFHFILFYLLFLFEHVLRMDDIFNWVVLYYYSNLYSASVEGKIYDLSEIEKELLEKNEGSIFYDDLRLLAFKVSLSQRRSMSIAAKGAGKVRIVCRYVSSQCSFLKNDST